MSLEQPAQSWSRTVNYRRVSLYPWCLLIAAGVLLSGCVWTARQQPASAVPSQSLQETLTQQTTTNQELEGKLARQQLLLLEKEAREKSLSQKLEEAIAEVVRTKAKLRSLESKAEAASLLAEGEIGLKALKAKGRGGEKDASVLQAEDLLKASALELKKENYGGALYLATQAKVIIKEGQERSQGREKTPMIVGEVPFAIPLPLRLLSSGNTREGPGLDYKVLFTLQEGSALVGNSYKGLWVRVRAEDGRGGWIYYNLVGGR